MRGSKDFDCAWRIWWKRCCYRAYHGKRCAFINLTLKNKYKAAPTVPGWFKKKKKKMSGILLFFKRHNHIKENCQFKWSVILSLVFRGTGFGQICSLLLTKSIFFSFLFFILTLELPFSWKLLPWYIGSEVIFLTFWVFFKGAVCKI